MLKEHEQIEYLPGEMSLKNVYYCHYCRIDMLKEHEQIEYLPGEMSLKNVY